MTNPVLRFTVIAGAIVAAACVHDAPTKPSDSTTAARVPPTPSMQVTAAARRAQDYILDFTDNSLPADLAAQVQKAGGVLTTSMEQIGVAVATSDDPGFADRVGRIKGVFSVMPDIEVQWLDPRESLIGEEITLDEAAAPPPEALASVGAGESFRLVQWAPDAVSAPAAWDAGAMGAGARIAILDGGIHSTHIDIAPNLDVAHSRSFVPDQSTPALDDFVPFNFDRRRNATGACVLDDTFWHGTHVAGIAAAAVNDRGTAGIAPSATLVGVKVLHCGSGAFSWVINGILYAATPIAQGGGGADVINMSLGAAFAHMPRDTAGRPARDPVTGKVISANGNALLARAIGKATTYAYQNGVTVVASMGNSAIDFDHSGDIITLPGMAPHVIAVSATGPVGWALGATNVDRPASYTNYGQSAVDFAAPGGDGVLPGNQVCSIPRVGPGAPVTQFCFVFDFVFSTVRGSGTATGTYGWAAGTSMASPAVAGVAALIIGKHGRVGPAEVERRLRQSADDLGKPGNDDFYGSGRVNASRAIQ